MTSGNSAARVFDRLLSDVRDRRRSFTVYTTEEATATAVEEQFATRNVAIDRRSLPPTVPEGFLVVTDDEGFAGAIGLSTLDHLTAPPIVDPWEPDEVPVWYRSLLGVLSETVFVGLTRRQLLAATREIEDRAWRVGRGQFRVGFQSLSAFRAQRPLYRWLATVTDLDVHVYGRPDWDPGPLEGVTVHSERPSEIGRYWFLAFDGGDVPEQATLLVAKERDLGEFDGFWAYDADAVATVIEGLDRENG